MHKNKLRWLLSIILALTSNFIAGCADGPDVVHCASTPAENELICGNKKMSYKAADGWICATPFDAQREVDNCQPGKPPPAIHHCDISADESVFICASGPIPISQTDSWVCMSSPDTKKWESYCAKKRAGN